MHADGLGITSASGTFLCSSFAIVDLFVFLRVPSDAAEAHGSGPRG